MTTPPYPGQNPDQPRVYPPGSYPPPSGSVPPGMYPQPGAYPPGGDFATGSYPGAPPSQPQQPGYPQGTGYPPGTGNPPQPGYPPGAGYPQQPGYPPPGAAQPPGMYPPPAGYPADPGLPGPKPPISTNVKIVMAVLAVMVVAASIAWFVLGGSSDPDDAKVGDCLHWASADDVSIVGCGSDDAQYRVVGRVDDTSDVSECAAYRETDQRLYNDGKGGGKQYVLCVSLVLHVGDCVTTGANPDVVPCDGPGAAYRVEVIFEGNTDEDACGSRELITWVYPESKRVICLWES